jgi:hypothetical protein
MSAMPGKVLVDGIAEVKGELVFVLHLIQARDPGWVGRPFFARFDAQATWLDQLRPAFGEEEFFFAEEMRAIQRARRAPAWGQPVVQRARHESFGTTEWE